MYSQKKDFTRKLTMTGMIIALAVLVNLTRFYIPIGGSPILRVSLASPLLKFIAIAIDPIFGAIAGGLTDFLSYVLKPEGGPYFYEIAFTAAFDCLMTGLIWKWIKNTNNKSFSWLYLGAFGLSGIIGTVNVLTMSYLPESGFAKFLTSMKDIEALSYALITVGLIGLVGYFVTGLLWKKKNPELFGKALKLTLAIGVPSMFVNTINTFVLRSYNFIPDNPDIIYFMIPRWIKNFCMIIFSTYIQIFLMEIYAKVSGTGKSAANNVR